MPRKGNLDNEKWAARVGVVAKFVHRHGRLPRVADGPIGQWLSIQRSELNQEKSSMTPERQRVLDELVPGWRQPLPPPYRSWESRAFDLRVFVEREQRLPSSTARDEFERRLAQWLINQRSAANRGELHDARALYLDKHFEGWNPGRRKDRWFQRADELAAYVSEHGAFPLRTGGEHERVLADWLRNQRANAKAGIRMSPDRIAYLDRVIPGWRD